eukprot:CAMPEP_0183708056 /NCGR_PEP_ID=MMETSP0737-20130205/4447_1 /TAXON_ID=385413 /ORGANISM="Thalassiosira miniscula, Strain CCMP1093" /LENGTH=700 /DNA_ID=CAMNT_0025935845 /DNA_START=36 /DNA_END=2138 /DNA_ORIENTATION=-
MTKDNILGDISIGGDNDVAIKALHALIKSGKISVEDAKSAVSSARGSKYDEAKTATSADAQSTKNGSNGDKNNKNNTQIKNNRGKKEKQPEVYRTRHVALQFSYDGTEFSGFAQNIGKECDNSVEKALFAALEKTRLLVSPEENGMLVMNAANEEEKKAEDADGKKEENETEGSFSNKKKNVDSLRNAAQYSRCGRTDKGVHAHGQVVALYLKSAFPLSARKLESSFTVDGDDTKNEFQLLKEETLPKNSLDGLECLVPPKKNKKKSKKGGDDNDDDNGTPQQQQSFQQKTITEYDYPRMLNNILPPSIRILGWCPVSPNFSARFSCANRTYRYFFPRRNLDLAAMAQGLQYMMGRNDFRNMCKMNCEQVYNFERLLMNGKVVSPQRVYIVSTEEDEKKKVSSQPAIEELSTTQQESPYDICHVEIIGQAFLWHQIRCILSILFCVGRKLESPDIVQELLDIETNPRKPSYEMASEAALVLQDCTFARLHLGRTVCNLWNLTKVLERRWEDHAVAAERANDALTTIKSETEVRYSDVVEFVEKIYKNRKKKEARRINRPADDDDDDDDDDICKEMEKRAPPTPMISWGIAIKIIRDILNVHPYPPSGSTGQTAKGQTESTVHVPLLERSMGTTYEEKVRSILREDGDDDDVVINGKDGKRKKRSTKRKNRYEENIIKKRKTEEEDKAFYEHMLRQGGSSM